MEKDTLIEKINELNSLVVKLEEENIERNKELSDKLQNINDLAVEKEELIIQINTLKKKNESLAHEKIVPMNIQEINYKNKEKDDNKNKIFQLQEELNKNKEIIKNLESTIETYY